MSEWETLSRQIAFAGQVTDAATGAAAADVCVQITAAPPIFTTRVRLQAKLPGQSPLDRITSRADGSFFFLDLPDGVYTLTAWMTGRQPGYDPVVIESSVGRDEKGRIQTTQLQFVMPAYTGTVANPPETLLPATPTPTPMPVFKPTDLVGCQLWLDAAAISLVEGDSVAVWPDNSRQNHTVTQSQTANQPIYRATGLNGQPAVQFNGENQYLTLDLVEAATDHTFFFVMDNTPGAGHSHYLWDAQSGRLVLNAADTSSPPTVRFSDGTWRTVTTALAGPQALTWLFAGETGELFRNGTRLGTATYAPRPLDGTLTVAANYQGRSSFFAGLIAEIIYYNRALPEAERQAVENYLQGRYAIAT